MKRYKLGEISEIFNGSTPSTRNKDNYGGDIIWATPKDLSDQDSKYFYQGARNITQNGLKDCGAKMIPANNILMSSRAPIGLLAINKVECCTNQGFKNIVLNKSLADENYLYYYLKLHINQIQALGSGTTFKEISKITLEQYEITIPPLKEQQKIGRILSNIDDKIAINNQINAILERVARAIYEYYFVQFDFPNQQGKPYKSSGGAMRFDSTLNRPIPKDFEVLFLKNRLEFERGEEYGTSAYIEGKQDENCIKFYRVGDMDDSGNTYINEILHECPKVNIDDLLVSFDGSVGRIAYALNGTHSTGIRKIYDKKGILNSATLYFIFSDNFIQSTIKQYAVGTNILHAGSAIEYLAIPFDEKTYAIFQNHITPIFEKMKQTKLQNQKLKNLRDFLLPLLINAQVQI